MTQRATCAYCHRPISREGDDEQALLWCHDTGPHVDMVTCAPEDTGKPWGACNATPEETT